MLSVAGKVYNRILTDRVMEITKEKVSEEQGCFKRGRGCVDQIYSLKMMIEEYFERGKIENYMQPS